MQSFDNSRQAWAVHFGAQALETLANPSPVLHERGVVLTTSSLRSNSGLLARVEELLGDRHAATFAGCAEHAPVRTVMKAAECAREAGADFIVSLGGGSAVDTAKALALSLGAELDTAEQLVELAQVEVRPGGDGPPIALREVPLIAVPTTLSGAEYNAVGAVRDEENGVKVPFSHPGLLPAQIILDPVCASETPWGLWASTGVKTLGDGLEYLYSVDVQPFTRVVEEAAVRGFISHLPDSAHDQEAITQCFVAAWFTNFGAVGHVRPGIGAILRRELGALTGVPHGIATCALLAPVLRFSLHGRPELARELARAAGWSVDLGDPVETLIAQFRHLLQALDLEVSLRAHGVSDGDLDTAAERASALATGGDPRSCSREQARAILEESM